jgi:hypothetical protein
MSKPTQNLATKPKRFEDFLTSLVNLRWEEPAPIADDRDLNRFMKRFADDFGLFEPRFIRAFFGQNVPKEQALKLPSSLIPGRTAYETLALRFLYLVFRAAWVEPDANVREWASVHLRARLARAFYSTEDLPFKWTKGRVRLSQPPEELPVEKAFQYLLKHHGRARVCPNPECPASYFFAKRHTQRYCSPSCAQSGERETKRRWWAEHGANWRRAQKQAATTIETHKKTTTKRKKGK